ISLEKLYERGRVERGEFLPEGTTLEWCDTEVLRLLKRRALEALRKQVHPVSPVKLAAFCPQWQRIEQPRSGLDGLLDVLEQLQGAPMILADLESEVLPARVTDLAAHWLDELISSGEVVWRGLGPIGQRDGRIAFFLAD